MLINCLPRPSSVTDCFLWLTRSSTWPRHAFAGQKAKRALGCIKSTVTSKQREGIVPLCSAMVTPHLECCTQLWDPKISTWIAGASCRGDHTAAQWARAPLLWKQAERIRVGQPGEEKALKTPYSSLPVPQRGLQESCRGTFYKGTGQGGTASNSKRAGLD